MDSPEPPEVGDEVRGAVRFVLGALLLPGELDGWSIGWERDHLDEPPTWRLVVDVTVAGESHRGFVHQQGAGYPVEEGLDTFTDGFEDFISESRFGWGERRELAARPWWTA